MQAVSSSNYGSFLTQDWTVQKPCFPLMCGQQLPGQVHVQGPGLLPPGAPLNGAHPAS